VKSNELVEMFDRWLEAGYMYYIKDEATNMTDYEFDKMANDLLKNWDSFDHYMKDRVGEDSLRCGSCFHLKEDDYPASIRFKCT